MLSSSAIRFITGVTLVFAGTTQVFAQQVLDEAYEIGLKPVKQLVLSIDNITKPAELDVFFKEVQVVDGNNIGLHISFDPSINANLNAINLDFSIDELKWISVFPSSLLSEFEDGIVLDGRLDNKYLYFNEMPKPLGTIEGIVEGGVGSEDLLSEAENYGTLGVVEGDSLSLIMGVDRQIDVSVPERFVTVTRHDLWRAFPQKLIDQLKHLEAKGVIITVPSTYNGSFPVNPIELERFITLATENDLQVFASIKDDFSPASSGESKSEVVIRELVNYNNYVPYVGQITGVQVDINWPDIETYFFAQKNWFERATDLYASLGVENKNLSINLLLPEGILTEVNNDTIFKRFSAVSDSFTIKLGDKSAHEISGLLKPLANWAQENGENYRIAIEKRELDKNISGWMRPNPSGNVRMFAVDDNWAVILEVETIDVGIGVGLEFTKNNLENLRMFYGTGLLEFAETIKTSQEQDPSFRGVTIYGVTELN